MQATVSDGKIGHINGSEFDYYEADVVSTADYFPFGMEMVNRTYSSPSYRYGFNGKEKDDEAKGSGNQYDYGFRIYDPRLGRFLSVDPLTKSYPFYTPYSFAGNKPIWAIDLDGLEEVTFSDVWHGRANIVDWINDVGTWRKVNQTINPIYQAYEHGYEITTAKDARTGTLKGRGQAFTDAGVNVMGWLTFNRLLKVTTVAIPLETQMANNSRALSQPAKSVIQTAAMEATESKVQNTVTKPMVSGVAKATDVMRTETIGGNKAARTVGANMKILKNGGSLEPLEVANINNKLYVINGHHRLEAALRTGSEIRYTTLTKEQWQSYGYKTEADIIQAASEAGPQKIKLDSKIIKQTSNGAN